MSYDLVLADRLRDHLQGVRGLTERRMFGGLAFLVNGHLAVSASGRGGLMVRVDPDRTDELIADPAAERFVMRGRPMDGWLRVDLDETVSDEVLEHWVDLGLAWARSLPPKT